MNFPFVFIDKAAYMLTVIKPCLLHSHKVSVKKLNILLIAQICT
jgi:hypothetical protein